MDLREGGSFLHLRIVAGINHPKVTENRASGGPIAEADTNVKCGCHLHGSLTLPMLTSSTSSFLFPCE